MKHLVTLLAAFLLLARAAAQTTDTTALHQELDSLRTLGLQFLSNSKMSDAGLVYNRMAELSRQHLGTHNKYYWKAVHGQGICAVRAGKFDQSEPYFSEARDLAVSIFGEGSPEHAESLYRLGLLELERKRFDAAEKQFMSCLKFAEKGSELNGGILNSLVIMYIQTGRLEAAEAPGQEALAIYIKLRGKESVTYMNALTNMATLYKQMAEFEKAEKMYLESRELRAKVLGTKHPDYAQSLQNLAALYADMGRFAEAEPLYLDAKGIILEQLGPNHPKYAITLGNLGNVYLQTGRNDAAEALFREVLDIRKKTFGPDNPQYAVTLTILGKLYTNAGRFADAEAVLTEALRIYELESDPQKRHIRYPNTVYELGDTYWQQGKTAEAEPLLRQAKELGEKMLGTDHADYLTFILSLADFYAQTGDTAQATRFFREGLEFRDRFFQKAERYFSENDLLALHAFRHSEQDKLYTYVHRYPAGSGLLTQAFDFSLHYKNALLENRIKWKKAVQAADPDTRNVYLDWLSLHRRIAGEYAKPLAYRTTLATLEEQANALEKTVTERLGHLPASETRPDWQEVRKWLRPGEAAIEFVAYQRTGTGFPATKTPMCSALILRPEWERPLFVPLFSTQELGPLRATRHLYAFSPENAQPNLHTLVWKLLSQHLNGVRTIYYAPAGLLHRINLSAVPVSGSETIGDRFVLHNLGSTRQVAAPVQQGGFAGMDAALFGGVDYAPAETGVGSLPTEQGHSEKQGLSLGQAFRSLRGDDWPYLEWTLREAETTKSIWERAGGQAQVFAGQDATETALKQLGQSGRSPRVLHLATHGYFFPDPDSSAANGFQASQHPLMRSGLIMAGANAAWKGNALPGGQEDGILTAYEISQLDLSETELVVLSACETGLGDLVGNEGVFGLQRAFKLAGAKYVLMSLWNVTDQSTYEFMTAFYREWLERGKDIPTAYQSAQKQMRKMFDKPFNPSVWAGFVLIQ
ncbi:MAG: CHAT domain-containing tetratricopeptide repeat protein [Saprospiraceae bacterium]